MSSYEIKVGSRWTSVIESPNTVTTPNEIVEVIGVGDGSVEYNSLEVLKYSKVLAYHHIDEVWFRKWFKEVVKMNPELDKLDRLKDDERFLMMCKVWEKEGQCPVGLEWYVRDEWDMEKGSECLRWARCEERLLCDDSIGHIRPLYKGSERYLWQNISGRHMSSIPTYLCSSVNVSSSFSESIIWLLRRWIEVEPVVIWDGDVPKEVLSKVEAIDKYLKLVPVRESFAGFTSSELAELIKSFNGRYQDPALTATPRRTIG